MAEYSLAKQHANYSRGKCMVGHGCSLSVLPAEGRLLLSSRWSRQKWTRVSSQTATARCAAHSSFPSPRGLPIMRWAALPTGVRSSTPLFLVFPHSPPRPYTPPLPQQTHPNHHPSEGQWSSPEWPCGSSGSCCIKSGCSWPRPKVVCEDRRVSDY